MASPGVTGGAAIAGRPLLVWVIFLLTVVGALANAVSLWVVATGDVQLPPEQQAYVASRGALDYALAIGLSLLFLACGIALLMLRRVALTLFSVYFIATLAAHIYGRLDPVRAAAQPSGAGIVLGLGITLAIVIYAFTLKRNGTLR